MPQQYHSHLQAKAVMVAPTVMRLFIYAAAAAAAAAAATDDGDVDDEALCRECVDAAA